MLTSFNTCAVDAAYEAVLKRTFLAMSICIGCYFFSLVGIVIIYPKLGTNLKSHKEDKESKEESKSILKSDSESHS